MEQKAGYHHGNLRTALLEAAFSVLLEVGVEGLSLRGVARRAGVSPSAPYHHFKDKQAILTELAIEQRQRIGRAVMKAVDSETTPQGKLIAFGVAYVGYALGHLEEFRLMFSGTLQLHIPESNPRDTPIFKVFKGLIGELNEQQSAAELEVSVITAWSLVHGLAQLLIDGPLQGLELDTEGAAALTEQVMNGLALIQKARG